MTGRDDLVWRTKLGSSRGRVGYLKEVIFKVRSEGWVQIHQMLEGRMGRINVPGRR